MKHHSNFPKDKLTAISAEYQTGGVGKGDRSWVAATGKSILVTFVSYFPPKEAERGVEETERERMRNAVRRISKSNKMATNYELRNSHGHWRPDNKILQVASRWISSLDCSVKELAILPQSSHTL